MLSWRGNNPTVWLALQETSGKQTVVNPPQIALLTAKGTSQNHQIAFRKMIFMTSIATVSNTDSHAVACLGTVDEFEARSVQTPHVAEC